MKETLKIIFLASFVSAWCGANASLLPDSTQSEKARKKKFIEVHRVDAPSALVLRWGLLSQTLAPGSCTFEADGFRFTPMTNPTNGFSQKAFDKFYWYNQLLADLYIPYTDINSVTRWYGMTIKTKDGRKYRIVTRKAKKVREELRARLVDKM